MLNSARFTENLPVIAADAYRISHRLCGTCRDLHALWPYIRLARASTGIEEQASKLEMQLAQLFARGLRNVLIAGCADTGLLALVARAGSNHDPNIAVLDICETPLELCRRFAQQVSLSIETVRQDLLDLDIERRFDMVLVHGTLHFIAADRRAEVLARIRRALRPKGLLALMFNTSRPVAAEIGSDTHANYANSVLGELKRLGVPLPDTEEIMRKRLTAHSRRRELREGAFARPDDVEMLLDCAGFKLNSCARVDVNVAVSTGGFIARIAKQRFMAVAEPKSTT